MWSLDLFWMGMWDGNSFIDEGRNPDEFTKDLLNSCVQRNQVSKGKVDAFKVSSCLNLSIMLCQFRIYPN